MGSGLGHPLGRRHSHFSCKTAHFGCWQWGLRVEWFFMAIVDLNSPVFSHLLAPALPLSEALPSSPAAAQRSLTHDGLPSVSHAVWSSTPLAAASSNVSPPADSLCPENSNFFETLKSTRRLALCRELNARLADQLRRSLPDRLRAFPCLDSYDVHVGDGHCSSAVMMPVMTKALTSASAIFTRATYAAGPSKATLM